MAPHEVDPCLILSDVVAHSYMELAEAPRMSLEINCSSKCNQCTFNVKNERVQEKVLAHVYICIYESFLLNIFPSVDPEFLSSPAAPHCGTSIISSAGILHHFF